MTFEWGLESWKKQLSWVFVWLMESNQFDEETRGNSVFDWLPVPISVCRLGSDTYLDDYMNFDYPRNNFSKSFKDWNLLSQTHWR